jgi:hypothetical protein
MKNEKFSSGGICMATCSIAFHKMEKWYERIVRWLHYLAPVADLAARLWVARIFWMAGMVKLQSMTATVALFRYMYHVPLLPPVWAAYLGTGIEIIFSHTVGVGSGGSFCCRFFIHLQHHYGAFLSANGCCWNDGSGALGHFPAFYDGLWSWPLFFGLWFESYLETYATCRP